MKSLIFIVVVSLFSLSALSAEQEEESKQAKEFKVVASEYNLRVGEKLHNFGWRFLGSADKYCIYRSDINKHLINADRFEKERCPDVLVAVKK